MAEYVYIVIFEKDWRGRAPAPRVFRKSLDAYDCLWHYYLEKFDDEDEDEKDFAEQELMDNGSIGDVGYIEEVEVK